MPITYGNVGGAEPSTLTFRVGTVSITRGSTTEQQEILVLGDPQTSNAIARVTAAAPVSTEFGLLVRIASGPSSASDLLTQISGNSTVFQGTSPWVISGNSTVVQGTSPWVVGFQAGNISSNAQSGNSSGLTVRPVWSSSGVDQPVRALLSSTSADNPVSISGNSTVVQGTNPWVVSPNSTAFVKNAGFSVDSSNALNVKLDGSTALTIGSIAAGAGRINIGSTAADNAVAISGNSTVFQGTSPWVVGFQAGNISSVAQSGNSSGLTVRPVWSSSGVDQPVRANFSSTAADNPVLVSGNSTVFQGGSPWLVNIGTNLQSTAAPSSASSGLIVRQVIDLLLTTASTSALASTVLSIASSIANIRAYVTAFTLTSTNQTPAQWGFFSSNATLLWPMTVAAPSSGVAGMNLAVSPPGYLFRTAVGEALNFKTNGSTVVSVQLGVSYFNAP